MNQAQARPYPPALLAWGMWGMGAMFYLIGFFQRIAPSVFTDHLMREFSIGAAALGNLSAFYFYSYVAMQIPTGILADRWGPHKLLTLGAGIAALGSALFALSPNLWYANAGRLLIGGSVAVAFVSILNLSSHWFAPRHYAVATGLTLLTGVIGGVVAGVPLRMLVEAFGWHAVMWFATGLTALLSLAIWRWLRDDPSQCRHGGYASYFQAKQDRHGHLAKGERTPVIEGLREVLSYRNIWILLLMMFCVNGAILSFAGLWGVPYLCQIYGLNAKAAAAIASILLVAWALGGTMLGAWSERMGKRKPLYVLTTIIAVAGWSAAVFLPLPLWLLVAVLIPVGFASGNVIIGFTWAKESLPLRLMGTATGVCNTGSLGGVMVMQPVVGWMLDRHWTGAMDAGARIYDITAYQAGFALFPACIGISLALILFARESYCKQAN